MDANLCILQQQIARVYCQADHYASTTYCAFTPCIAQLKTNRQSLNCDMRWDGYERCQLLYSAQQFAQGLRILCLP